MRRDHHFSKILRTGILLCAAGFILAGCKKEPEPVMEQTQETAAVEETEDVTVTVRPSMTTTPMEQEKEEPVAREFPEYEFFYIAIDSSSSAQADSMNQNRMKLASFYTSLVEFLYDQHHRDLEFPGFTLRHYSSSSTDEDEITVATAAQADTQMLAWVNSRFTSDINIYNKMSKNFTTWLEDQGLEENKGKLVFFTDGIILPQNRDQDSEDRFMETLNLVKNLRNIPSTVDIDIILTCPMALLPEEIVFWSGLDHSLPNVHVHGYPKQMPTLAELENDGDRNVSRDNPQQFYCMQEFITNWVKVLFNEFGLPYKYGEDWVIVLNNEDEIARSGMPQALSSDITFSVPWYTNRINYYVYPITWIASAYQAGNTDSEYWQIEKDTWFRLNEGKFQFSYSHDGNISPNVSVQDGIGFSKGFIQFDAEDFSNCDDVSFSLRNETDFSSLYLYIIEPQAIEVYKQNEYVSNNLDPFVFSLVMGSSVDRKLLEQCGAIEIEGITSECVNFNETSHDETETSVQAPIELQLNIINDAQFSNDNQLFTRISPRVVQKDVCSQLGATLIAPNDEGPSTLKLSFAPLLGLSSTFFDPESSTITVDVIKNSSEEDQFAVTLDAKFIDEKYYPHGTDLSPRIKFLEGRECSINHYAQENLGTGETHFYYQTDEDYLRIFFDMPENNAACGTMVIKWPGIDENRAYFIELAYDNVEGEK